MKVYFLTVSGVLPVVLATDSSTTLARTLQCNCRNFIGFSLPPNVRHVEQNVIPVASSRRKKLHSAQHQGAAPRLVANHNDV